MAAFRVEMKFDLFYSLWFERVKVEPHRSRIPASDDALPVTQRDFKTLSFSVMAATFPSPSLNNNKWYFTREQIENSPSRRAGLDPDKELSYRQQAANLLQDMGQRLNVYLFQFVRRRSR